jgi:peptide-methionine (R)-S-oxide reductase
MCTMIGRRAILRGGVAGLGGMLGVAWWATRPSVGDTTFEIVHSDEEWQSLLTPEQYAVLRESATEPPFTSPLLDEKRAGNFACAGCDVDLFSSTTKFESGTGWPSFWAPLESAVGQSEDISFGMVRTEVHCNRCGGHLGHVFDDGPQPTGLRYCINGLALTFKPAAA